MWARSLQPTVACVVLAVLVLVGIACGSGGQGVTANTSTSRLAGGDGDGGSSTTFRPGVTWTTASTLPGPADPRACGVVTAPGGALVRIVVVQGDSSCADAEALVGGYYDDAPDRTEDPQQHLVIDGWECATDHEVEGGPVTTCTLPGFGLVGAAPDPS